MKDMKIGGRTVKVSTKELVAKDVVVKSTIDRLQRRKLPADKVEAYLEHMKHRVVKNQFLGFKIKLM